MTKVLFVCLGNICRSPLAEGIFRQMTKSRGLENEILCDSCGTSNYHIGSEPDERTRANANVNGVKLYHKARQFKASDFEEFDYIMPMDASNFRNITVFPQAKTTKATLQLMREYDPEGKGLDVPDPYYGGEQGFQEVFDILNRSCASLLDQILQRQEFSKTQTR